MLQFFASLLALFIFLSGPAMKGNAEIWHSPLAAKTPPLKYHYTTAPESSFQNGLWRDSSVTDKLYTDAVEAGQMLRTFFSS